MAFFYGLFFALARRHTLQIRQFVILNLPNGFGRRFGQHTGQEKEQPSSEDQTIANLRGMNIFIKKKAITLDVQA